MNILCAGETARRGRPWPEKGVRTVLGEPLSCPNGNAHVWATAYLGGPMRGLPYWNFPAFQDAAEELRDKGWTIHSPAEHDLSMGLTPVADGTVEFPVSACLDWDFARIAESSCVIVLPGWEKSTGCHWEFTVAYALGKPVYQYPELTPVELPKVVTAPVEARLSPQEEAHIRNVRSVPDYFSPGAVIVKPEETLAQATYAHVRGVDGPGAYARTTEGTLDGIVPRASLEQLAEIQHRGEIRVIDPKTGGQKGSKPERFDLIPADVMEELARHYGRGCLKYADRNWERGYKWSLSVAALERHLNLWKQRQDIDHDPEVGDFPHLVAVIWHACALLAFSQRGIGTDDRA